MEIDKLLLLAKVLFPIILAFAFDKNNNLFTELTFGPISKRIIFSSSEPNDYFRGKIYTVTDDFKDKFEKSHPRIYPLK